MVQKADSKVTFLVISASSFSSEANGYQFLMYPSRNILSMFYLYIFSHNK